MSLLDRPRCPNCNSEIDLKELWRAAPKTGRGIRLDGKIGIVCPVCGIKLRVADGRVFFFYMGLFLLMLCAAMVFGKLSRSQFFNERAVLLGFFVVYGAFFVLFNRTIPRLLRLRRLEDGEKPKFPLEADRTAHAEASQLNQEQFDSESPDAGQPTWVCPKCHEENPGNFDECWKCQTWRTGTPDTPAASTTTND